MNFFLRSVMFSLLLPMTHCLSVQAADDLPRRAEELYNAGKLIEAESLFTELLKKSATPGVRRQCYERLIIIHSRLGRPDRAVQSALDYRAFLGNSDPGRSRQLNLDLAVLYAALGHNEDAGRFAGEALHDRAGPPPSVLQNLQARTLLARSAEASGERENALRHWRQLEEFAATQLAQLQEASLRIECAWALADCSRVQQRPTKGISPLQALLPLHDDTNDMAGKIQTLRRLAELQVAAGQFAAAEKTLHAACEANNKLVPENRLILGDLLADLAIVVRQLGRQEEADTLRDQAADCYAGVMRRPQPGEGGAAVAFFKLQTLFQAWRQFQQALQLTRTQAEEWANNALLAPRLQAGRGSLEMHVGSYAKARTELLAAVASLREQKPRNLVQFPRALIGLAMAEAAGGDLAQAEKLAKECQELYRQHRLREDVVLADALSVLGKCSAASGNYAVAKKRFDDGLDLCHRLGEAADPQRAGLLINIALLHKSQGDVKEALATCTEAEKVYRRCLAPDDLVFTVLYAARINLLLIQGKLSETMPLADALVKLCQRHRVEEGPLQATARFCQGLNHLSRKEYADAESVLTRVVEWQENNRQFLQAPRTLNYLGLAAELQNQPHAAERYYRRAQELQADMPHAFPATHFITLWRLAVILDGQQQFAQARDLLEKGAALVDKARLGTYGDARQRAVYFAQFAQGLEQMVDWCVRDNDLEAALVAITRSRSRTLLDQLLQAGADPRKGLKGRDENLLLKEADLRRQIADLRARAQMTATDLEDDPVQIEARRQLLDEFAKRQEEYASVWRDVLNANPVYRELASRDLASTLPDTLRKSVLRPGTALLVYHIGRERSYLLLASERLRHLEVFHLQVPRMVSLRAAPFAAGPQLVLEGRGLRLRPQRTAVKAPATDPLAGEPSVPMSERVASILTDHYLDLLADPKFDKTRGLTLRTRDGPPLATQQPELVGDVFLPLAARRRLAELAPDCLIVVPDGPLHRLPLEALRVRNGDGARYLLEELPPVVYSPSTAILGLLAERPAVKRKNGLSLLTVGDPAYSQPSRQPGKEAAADGLKAKSVQEVLAGWQLGRLKFSADESQFVRRHFDPKLVKSLDGEQATEGHVVAAMPGRNIVHLAAHGIIDEEFGNLFGAILLTPPAVNQGIAEDDGRLSLNEISLLDLSECELAVLSACMTNVGPQETLEAGVTLASGFLTAGARRVIASHWSVDDEATAELMKTFFAKVAASAQSNTPLAPARALRHAQLQLQKRWQSPWYWAPFVVIGPPDPE